MNILVCRKGKKNRSVFFSYWRDQAWDKIKRTHKRYSTNCHSDAKYSFFVIILGLKQSCNGIFRSGIVLLMVENKSMFKSKKNAYRYKKKKRDYTDTFLNK